MCSNYYFYCQDLRRQYLSHQHLYYQHWLQLQGNVYMQLILVCNITLSQWFITLWCMHCRVMHSVALFYMLKKKQVLPIINCKTHLLLIIKFICHQRCWLDLVSPGLSTRSICLPINVAWFPAKIITTHVLSALIIERLSCLPTNWCLKMQEKATPMYRHCIDVTVLNPLCSTVHWQYSVQTRYVFYGTLLLGCIIGTSRSRSIVQCFYLCKQGCMCCTTIMCLLV